MHYPHQSRTVKPGTKRVEGGRGARAQGVRWGWWCWYQWRAGCVCISPLLLCPDGAVEVYDRSRKRKRNSEEINSKS